MSKTALLFILIIPTLAYAQTWAPLGAKWTYTQPTINPNYTTYTTIESTADTVVNGQSCKMIREIKRNSPVSADTLSHYMYSNNNQVYFWKDSIWCLLYDFNAQQGDTFRLDCILKSNGQPLDVIIQSVDTITISGQHRKVFNYLATDLLVEFSGIVIEGIGHTLNMFPTYENQYFGALRCYEDSGIGLYKNQYYYGATWNQDCDQILTGIHEQTAEAQPKAYPNPVINSLLQVEIPSVDNLIQVTNVLGQVLINQTCSTSCVLDLSEYPNGLYVLKISDKRKGVTVVRIVKDCH